MKRFPAIQKERERRVYGQGAIHEGVLLCDPRRENVQLANRPLSDFFSQKISILLTTQTGCYDVQDIAFDQSKSSEIILQQ